MMEQDVNVAPARRTVARCTVPCLALAAAALLAGCGGDAPAAGTPDAPAAGTPDAPAATGPASSPAPPAAPPAAHSTIDGPPPLAFEPPVLDLGLLGVGQSGSGTVKVRNVGDRTVKILTTKASCACTYAKDISGTVLAPGEAVDLSATLEPKPGVGDKKEQIRVVAAGYTEYVTLDVIGEVALAIRAIPAGLPAFQVGLTGQVDVVSLDGEPFRIVRAGGRPPQFVGFDPASDAPRNRYTLRWDLTSYTTQTMPWWWVVETDRPDAPLVDVRVMHDSTKIDRSRVSRWIRGDLRILAGVLGPGQTYDFRTKLQYNPKSRPDPGPPQVAALTPGIRAELVSHEAIGSDMHCTIRVTVLREEPGLLYEKINITAGGFSSPIWFIATLDN
jgi:hypothetical protein